MSDISNMKSFSGLQLKILMKRGTPSNIASATPQRLTVPKYLPSLCLC